MLELIARFAETWVVALTCSTGALSAGCNHVAEMADPVVSAPGGGRAGGVRPQPAPQEANAEAPRPQLGAVAPAAGGVLGLTQDEIARVNAAPSGSRLAKLRGLVLKAARLADPVLKIEPGRHLIDRKMNRDVPAALALDLGFLIQWNETVDALGLAYVLTGDTKYAKRVDEHLQPWAAYSPPHGGGLTAGGEPSIYHRNFFGCLRAAEHCFTALSPVGRQAAVKLALTISDRLEDWWSKTPWERGNHAAATAQTGLCAGLLLTRAAAIDPALITPEAARARVEKFLNAGASLAPATLVGGEQRVTGLLGFGPQALIGVMTQENSALYQARWSTPVSMLGTTMDFIYKPADQRFSYHALAAHHLLTSYWATVRSGLDRGTLSRATETRGAIGLMLEFSRPYLELGQSLPTAKGKAPVPSKDGRTREIVAMAARLFPEKAWLESGRLRGEPVSFAEIYAEVANFQ